jgi:hypothetical protein
MKIQFIFFVLLYISVPNLSFAILNQAVDEIRWDMNVNYYDDLALSVSAADSNVTMQDTVNEEPARINQLDFYYADNPRYTINGNLPFVDNNVDALRFGIFGGLFTGFMTYQHIYQVNTIWSKTTRFRFIEDGNYALYSDKIGHFYGAYFSSYVYTEALMWSGFNKNTAHLTGAIMGVAYSTYVEVMDGFAEDWGFSPSDFYSDVAGFGFFLLQYYVPWFQNVTPKFMYIPAEWHGERRRSPSEFFIDDYSSQTLYLTFNIYNMLPDNMKQYWLPWLQLTVGYAARNLCNPSDPNSNCDFHNSTRYSDFVAGSPRFIIGLDYDLVKLLPDGIPLWNWIRQTLNYIKFPAPAIEISEQGTRFMLMYPFLSL